MAPQDDVQTIKDKLNIADIVGQYVQLKRAGRNWSARCPFHNERTPSFHVSPERGTYMCFGCGEKGDIFSFVERIEGVDFKTALEQLAAKAGVTLQRTFTPKSENTEKDERLRECLEAAASFYQARLGERSDVAQYLVERGVHRETVGQWRLGYAPAAWQELSDHLRSCGFTHDELVESGLSVASQKRPGEVFDRFRGRIMFPIADAQGRVIGFSGRLFEKVAGAKDDGEPAKYVNSPETALFKKSKVLFGYDHAKQAIRKADCILLVEGQFDVVLSHQSGLPFTVALSGTALTPEHLSLLSRLSKRLVLALDADEAGIRSGLKSTLMALETGFDVKVPQFPKGKDPADVAREDKELLKSAIRGSKPAIEFFLGVLRERARDERAYAQAVEAHILPLIAAVESKIEQEQFVRLAAKKLGASEEAVRAELKKRVTGPGKTPSAAVAPGLVPSKRPALEEKASMLIYRFAPGDPVRETLNRLLGEERARDIEERFAPEAEELRFKFDRELGEHTDERTIAQDMLSGIELLLRKEKIAGAGEDARRITEAARNAHNVQKP